MAESTVADKAVSGRLLAASLTILLYFIPFYQKYFSGPPEEWTEFRIAHTQPVERSRQEAPYFAADFVNQAKPGVMCHVPSIAVAGKDKLICTWYAGSREAASDVAVYAAFFQENTGKWTEPEVLVDRISSSRELRRWVGKVGNAVVMNDNHGRLWLFYASLLGGWSTASLNYKVSRDEGRTWTASRKMILSPFFNLTNNVKNGGQNLSRAAFLLPVYHEFLRKFSNVVLVRPQAEKIQYEMRRITRTGKAIQPVLIPWDGQNLLAVFRNAAGGGPGHILKAESRDVGRHWSGLTATPLPNPDSGFDMIRLGDGAILGAINQSFQERDNLTLVISRDGGMTWADLYVLENTPGKEYAYPFLARSGRYYHLTYSYERSRIKHVVFNEAWLQGLIGHVH